MSEDEPQVEILMTYPKPTIRKLVNEPHLNIDEGLYNGKADYKKLEEFLCSRLPDRRRKDMDRILKNYGLTYFNPYDMCRKSHGRNMTDFVWIKYDDEELKFNDIRLR